LLAIRVGQQGFDQSRQHGLMGRLFAVNGWERIELLSQRLNFTE
jgi:hypothetical protein